MTIVRNDFIIKLNIDEVNTLMRAQNMLRALNTRIEEGLSENERKSKTYFDIKNSINRIIIDTEHFFNLPEIILD